jgi:hypothetical protein
LGLENRIKEGRLESSQAAIQMDPANSRLIAHFGLGIANLSVAEKAHPDNARRARVEADYQTAPRQARFRQRRSGKNYARK